MNSAEHGEHPPERDCVRAASPSLSPNLREHTRPEIMAALQANSYSLRSPAPAVGRTRLPALSRTRLRCSASAKSAERSYSVTLLPGDGIGPEVVAVAKDVLYLAGSLEGNSLSLSVKKFAKFR
jgi:hypothetical protein